jgi:hypothetical protein
MSIATKIISLKVKEYDLWAGCIQCVNNEVFPADWLGDTESTVRNFLAGGDYSEGDENRRVEVSVITANVGQYHATYSAPQIRRFKHRAGTK